MLNYKQGLLQLDGHPLSNPADGLATPFFLLSEVRLRDNYHALVRGLSHHGTKSRIRYCAKANNEAGVLKTLAECGSEILVSHLAEAQLALQCGYPPERIAYQRPVLEGAELRRAISMGVTLFHAFRLEDLTTLNESALETGAIVRVSLRLRNGSLASRFSPLGFLSHRLGFKPSEVLPAVAFIRELRGLRLEAINTYQGTQRESPGHYGHLLRRSVELAAKIHARFGFTIGEINLGGGIPSPSMRRLGIRALWRRIRSEWAFTAPEGSLEGYARDLSEKFRQEVQSRELPKTPTLTAEPGRSVVGDAGVLVTRVCAVQGRWAFLDASRNYLGENPLYLTRRIMPLDIRSRRPNRHYHLSGGTLNATDVIDLWRHLPKLVEGDMLALCDAGAYSISRASRYAGLAPAVYMLHADGALEMIRRPEKIADLVTSMTVQNDPQRSTSWDDQ